jgi:phosphopantetheinyl transferase (holo-ACP synthase)
MASDPDGIVGEAFELVEIAEVTPLLHDDETGPFTAGELGFARATSDPERRLAARLAAKRAACRLLGGETTLRDVEVVRGRGAPSLRLSPRAEDRLAILGAKRTLVSLTHERRHAAALVLLVEAARPPAE